METRGIEAGVDQTPPREQYQGRLESSQARAKDLARWDDLAGNARLIVFLGVALLGYLAWQGTLGWAWCLAALVAFVVIVVAHGRVLRSRKRAEGVSSYHERGLARLDGRWAGTGVTGTRFFDEAHPYASDLDIFGEGSLFERLCTARTASGEAALAAWLLAPAPIDEIRRRHEAVTELRPRLDLREDLALLGDDVRSGVAPEALAAWGDQPHRSVSVGLRIVVGLIAIATTAILMARLLEAVPTWPLIVLLVIEVVIAYSYGRRTGSALADVENRSGELETLAGLLARVESESFESPRLKELRATLGSEKTPASVRIARLARLVGWLEARHNVYFALFGSVLLWKTQFGLAIEAWRAKEGKSIGRWLAVVGQVEAYVSLANYAFENPADPFPDFTDDGPRFEGEGLGHPLLSAEDCIRNNIPLGGDLKVLAVSGSNMSGKSTWLRTLGVNAVLAQAGAPVRAFRLSMSPLAIGGTLRVQDSLQAGRSRFQAEILRVKQLVDLSRRSPPLLFLIDEIFSGTNSADRLIAGQRIIRDLIDHGAIGLFTTHDLTLAEVADELAPRARNVHFADHLDNEGKLTFDYTMRDGVVRQSNALALMRAVGLDV